MAITDHHMTMANHHRTWPAAIRQPWQTTIECGQQPSENVDWLHTTDHVQHELTSLSQKGLMWGSCISQLLCTITRYLRIPEANNVERERACFYPLFHVFYAKILCLFCFRPLAKAAYQGRRTWQTQLLCPSHELKVMRDWGPTVLLSICPQWLRDLLLALYPKGASSTTLGT